MTRKLVPGRRGANPERLTAQQLMFVEAFFANKSMNAAQAAREAGYSGASAAAKLLATPQVKATIQKRMNDIIWAHRADRDRIVSELTSIAFANPQDVLNLEDGTVIELKDLPQHVSRAISRMKLTVSEGIDDSGNPVRATSLDISYHDKLTAITLLMRHLGMMDTIKHEVKVGVDWDSMAKPHANPEAAKDEATAEDPIEKRIAMYEQGILDGETE